MKCQHHACRCDVASGAGVTRDGKTYCSERCADDRGCDHADCNCGKFPTAQPHPTPHTS